MFSLSRFNAASRVLSHYYHHRLRGRVTGIALPADLGEIELLTLSNSEISLRGRLTRPVRAASERQTQFLRPERGGTFEAVLPGTRYLQITDPAHEEYSVTLALAGRGDHLTTFLRCLADLALFGWRARRDIAGYFLRGDSEAGDRLERGLLPFRQDSATRELTAGHTGLARGQTPADGVLSGPPDDAQPAALIILPVYNARALVAECLDHLGRNTSGSHRILIIDDASPDPEIRPLLERWVSDHPQAELWSNPQNLGFVGTVNRGLAAARGAHVVLLNSDAMVPQDWLSRLLAPLHDPSIASVTPLSNDAEIFDAPVECRARVLHPGEAEAADRMARRLSGDLARAQAPTGVGFCMAMGRDWLGRVPQFDTIFGRGYGEEVDWCRRTAALGAIHIGIGNLFVEHRSGSSFGDEKPERVRQNNRIISARYPGYDLMVQEFRDLDPLAGPRLAVGLALLAGWAGRSGGFPVWLAHRLGGGAELWLRDRIAQDIARHNGALVLRDASEEPGADPGLTLVELHSAQGVTRALLTAEDVAALLVALPEPIEIGYSCLVGARDPLAIMGNILDILDRRAEPLDRLHLLFHDFLPLCPSYTLIGADRRYCGLPGAGACQSCYAALPVTSGRRPERIADWRAQWRAVAQRADWLEVFSEDSRRHVETVWPEFASRIRVRPHRPEHLPQRVPPGGSPVLTIGILGGIGYNKGAGLLHALATRIQRNSARVRLVLIGKIDPSYAHTGILVHGPYDRSEIASLARYYALDAWLLPSIWPETFSYTAHECIATGLPVIGFDLGAQGDALHQARNGILLPVTAELTPELLAQILSERVLA